MVTLPSFVLFQSMARNLLPIVRTSSPSVCVCVCGVVWCGVCVCDVCVVCGVWCVCVCVWCVVCGVWCVCVCGVWCVCVCDAHQENDDNPPPPPAIKMIHCIMCSRAHVRCINIRLLHSMPTDLCPLGV